MTRWVSVARAAELLGIGPAAVRARARRGTLEARRRRDGWVIDASALDEVLVVDAELAAAVEEAVSRLRGTHASSADLAALAAELDERLADLTARIAACEHAPSQATLSAVTSRARAIRPENRRADRVDAEPEGPASVTRVTRPVSR